MDVDARMVAVSRDTINCIINDLSNLNLDLNHRRRLNCMLMESINLFYRQGRNLQASDFDFIQNAISFCQSSIDYLESCQDELMDFE